MQEEVVLCDDPQMETQQLLREKAVELFGLCDKECKGFITRRDLLRLTHELPLSGEVLEEVFDKLDDDGNGYLSLEEFTDGFGRFLCYAGGDEDGTGGGGGGGGGTVGDGDTGDSSDNDSELFDQMLRQIHGEEIVKDPHSLKHIWKRLRGSDPSAVNLFEEFICKVVRDMRKTIAEQRELEQALKTRSVLHDEELTKLYEEMETQIELERQRVKRHEQEREQKLRDDLTEEVYVKEKQLHEIILKKNSLADQVRRLQGEEHAVREENEQLLRKNEDLEEAVKKLGEAHAETQSYLKQIKDQMIQEKRDRAKAALKVNESIARERIDLVNQLDELREQNKSLKDERDELLGFKANVGMIEDLLKQVQNRAMIEVSDSDQESTANDVSDIPSGRSSDNEEGEGGLEGQRHPLKGRSLEHDSGAGGGGGGGGAADSPASGHRGRRGEGERGAAGGSRRESFNARCSSAEPLPKTKRDSVEGKGGKSMKKLTSVDRTRSISVEKFSSNLNALISSNQLQVTTLQIPTNAPIGGRKGSIIADYMSGGEKSDVTDSEGEEGEEEEICWEGSPSCELGDDTDIRQEYARRKQLFFDTTDGGSCVDWNRTISRNSVEASGGGGPTGVAVLDLLDESRDHDSFQHIKLDTPGTAFQEMTQDAFSSVTRHRVFKVVFVGDSGVGKTSFISRLCSDSFRESISATVGVDYQVKQLVLDNTCYSLQFWDTAGQERFRSVTKQYYRRTDAIVVMYDVTSEKSMLNVRDWMNSIKEDAEDDIILFLLGSKVDLRTSESSGRCSLSFEEGQSLADNFGATFLEVSSRTGEGVQQAIQSLAHELALLEDKDLEDAKNIKLKQQKKKKGCC